MSQNLQLEDIERRLHALPTPDDWRSVNSDRGSLFRSRRDVEIKIDGPDRRDVLEFIVHAPQDIQALISEVKRLRGELDDRAS